MCGTENYSTFIHFFQTGWNDLHDFNFYKSGNSIFSCKEDAVRNYFSATS